jgi:hypothetical protein
LTAPLAFGQELVAAAARAQGERDVARMECSNLAKSLRRYRSEVSGSLNPERRDAPNPSPIARR